MMALSYPHLLKRLDKLRKRPACTNHYAEESRFLAYMDGLTRFISYGGERAKMLRKLQNAMVVAYMALERVKESRTIISIFM
jgi:ABC-type hemin transport system substrate-binding protein